jgi:hypothetical protein
MAEEAKTAQELVAGLFQGDAKQVAATVAATAPAPATPAKVEVPKPPAPVSPKPVAPIEGAVALVGYSHIDSLRDAVKLLLTHFAKHNATQQEQAQAVELLEKLG